MGYGLGYAGLGYAGLGYSRLGYSGLGYSRRMRRTRQSLPPLYESDISSKLYLSNAVLITPNATLVCSWTAFNSGVGASVSRKAFSRAASLAQMGRMVSLWPLTVGALSPVSSGARSGISFIPIHVSCYMEEESPC